MDVKLTKSNERYLEDLKEELKRVQEVADEVALRARREYVGHYNKHAKIMEFNTFATCYEISRTPEGLDSTFFLSCCTCYEISRSLILLIFLTRRTYYEISRRLLGRVFSRKVCSQGGPCNQFERYGTEVYYSY